MMKEKSVAYTPFANIKVGQTFILLKASKPMKCIRTVDAVVLLEGVDIGYYVTVDSWQCCEIEVEAPPVVVPTGYVKPHTLSDISQNTSLIRALQLLCNNSMKLAAIVIVRFITRESLTDVKQFVDRLSNPLTAVQF